jgi:hypothetical protein
MGVKDYQVCRKSLIMRVLQVGAQAVSEQSDVFEITRFW